MASRFAPSYLTADTVRFVLSTLLPWLATCLIIKRYLEDKKSSDPSLELVSCRVFDKKIEIILLNTSASFANIIEWGFTVNEKETIILGKDKAVSHHHGSRLFTAPCEVDCISSIERIRIWTAQRELPWVFYPPFHVIEP